jgi:hypothetical protein
MGLGAASVVGVSIEVACLAIGPIQVVFTAVRICVDDSLAFQAVRGSDEAIPVGVSA